MLGGQVIVLTLEILASEGLQVVDVLLQVVRLLLDIISGGFLVALGEVVTALEQLLLGLRDLIDLVVLESGHGDLLPEHGDDQLDRVDLSIDGLGLGGALSESLQELDALDLGLVDEVHVLVTLVEQLALQAGRLLVGGINAGQILVVGVLEAAGELADLAAGPLELLELVGAHICLVVECFPLLVISHI